MPNRNTLPSNGQDTPAASKSDEDDDRDDNIMDEEEEEEPSSSDTASSSHERVKHDFTFMGGNNDETSAAFDQISKFPSVEQYREFLEKELGEERLMKAYPKLKEFVSYLLPTFILTYSRMCRVIKSSSSREPPNSRPYCKGY